MNGLLLFSTINNAGKPIFRNIFESLAKKSQVEFNDPIIVISSGYFSYPYLCNQFLGNFPANNVLVQGKPIHLILIGGHDYSNANTSSSWSDQLIKNAIDFSQSTQYIKKFDIRAHASSAIANNTGLIFNNWHAKVAYFGNIENNQVEVHALIAGSSNMTGNAFSYNTTSQIECDVILFSNNSAIKLDDDSIRETGAIPFDAEQNKIDTQISNLRTQFCNQTVHINENIIKGNYPGQYTFDDLTSLL